MTPAPLLVSIGLPVRNAENRIAATIRTVLDQDHDVVHQGRQLRGYAVECGGDQLLEVLRRDVHDPIQPSGAQRRGAD